MKRLLFLLAFCLVFFWSCDTSTNPKPEDSIVTPERPVIDPENPPDVNFTDLKKYEAVDSAKSIKWIRYPRSASTSFRGNIATGDPDAALCTEPGWSYMFYDDGAIIGYEPFPEFTDLMQRAVQLTVEVHNQGNPEAEWGYINVPLPSPPLPDTSHDPVLGHWQFAICIDDGSIVDGPYTAEFDFEWAYFKDRIAAQRLETYNNDNDPDAHIVWGTD